MNKFRLVSAVVMISFSNLVFAQSTWDIRAIANSSSAVQSLVLQDKTPYMNMPVSHAKSIIEIADRYSALSGIYPKIYLKQSNELNASAGFPEGTPVIVINKPMYELMAQDKGAAAALIGHEMAHLYFRHSDGRAEAQANAAAVGALIGTLLELLFIGRFGVVGLGTNLGSALSSGITGSYTRPQESEADRQGMIWAIQAGYDPNGSERLFTAFEKQNGNSFLPFLNSHPNPSDRIEAAKEAATLYGKYKNLEIINSPELQALNKVIDEDRERQLPKSDAARAGAVAFNNKDYAASKASYEQCAQQGEIACINNLGVLYQYGLGIQADKNKAATYYKQAADKGSGLALYNYIPLYVAGIDGQPDTFKTLKLEKEASERGSPNAMGTLAVTALMSQSFGFPREWQDKVDAVLPPQKTLVNYAKAAAMRGSRDGQTALGNYYLYGFGVPKNVDLAENYLLLASKAGDIRADAALVILYENEKIDPAKAAAIKEKYKNNPNLDAGLAVLMSSYYCRADVAASKKQQCFSLVKKGRSFSVGPVIYGYVLSEGIGVERNAIEGNAWLLYAANKTGHTFASWVYARNIANLSQADIEKIKNREKEIAINPNLQQ